jgi:hypothetical protein
MMAAIALLALALTVIVQSVRLNQALVRQEQLRAEAEFERAQADKVEYARQMDAAQAEWQRLGSPAAPRP